jgi:hypothetical protein
MDTIDDKYLQRNADEIVKLMVKQMPSKASSSRNWRFALKKEGASNNISYVGFALAYKNSKKLNEYDSRVDAMYDKESLLLNRIKEADPRITQLEAHIGTAKEIFRDYENKIVVKFYGEDYDDEAKFDRESFRDELRSKHGNFLL